MSRGKHLSLEEARQDKLLKQFVKEHPSEGDEKSFDKLLSSMAGGSPPQSNNKQNKGKPAK